jgi:ABC-type branched-subunit amino acid transport system substrate-binding protein
MRTAPSRRLAALLFTLCIAAAACGGADEPAGGDASEASGSSSATAAEATEATEEPTQEPTADDTEEAAATEATEPDLDAAGGGSDDALSLAYLLPETGQLAFLGPPIISAFELAIEDINAAGGVNGAPVESDGGDEGDGDGTVANATADRLLAAGVDGIVGAASSGTSLTVIDKITGAGTAMCSPSNTSPTFTGYDDGGLYFRTAPTDALQGPVLAEQVVAAGATSVAILARADDYGQGLLDATEAALADAGAEVALAQTYEPTAQAFDAEVQAVVDSGADAVVLVAFDEGARILQTMIEAGVGPADVVVFGADGLNSSELPGLVSPDDPAVLDGMGVTAPATSASEEFQARLQEFEPSLEDFGFAAEAYDCAVAMALAAAAGQAGTAEAIAGSMVDVTREGTTCTTYEECLALIEQGEDIDYDGVSGPLDFTDAGEPSTGTYDVKRFDASGELVTEDTITSEGASDS